MCTRDWRDAKRRCPDCHQETIYESKKKGGWFCWKAKGGCGNEFAQGDARIAGQPIGKVRNPDIADLSNTILKIAGKRAYVAATLLATALGTRAPEKGAKGAEMNLDIRWRWRSLRFMLLRGFAPPKQPWTSVPRLLGFGTLTLCVVRT